MRTKFYGLSQLKFLIKFFLQFLVPTEHISTLNSTLEENLSESDYKDYKLSLALRAII